MINKYEEYKECIECKSPMTFDDVDYNFKCKKRYWICPHCNTTCIEEIYHSIYKEYWDIKHKLTPTIIKDGYKIMTKFNSIYTVMFREKTKREKISIYKINKAYSYKLYIFSNPKNKNYKLFVKRRYRRMYYLIPLIRKFNDRPNSLFGKRVKERYNSFNTNWRIIYE